MRHYEVMVILDPSVEERAVAPLIENFANVVRTGGGSVEKVDTWGRRRLAYEIKKQSEGIYSVLDIKAEPAVVKERFESDFPPRAIRDHLKSHAKPLGERPLSPTGSASE